MRARRRSTSARRSLIGVPPSGPMDNFAFRLANRIVGNHASAAGLEFTLQGPTLRFHSDTLIALTGADCPASLDGEPVTYWQPITVKAGQLLYRIDPATYQASVDSAKATLAKARANVETLRPKAARYKELAEIKAVAQQDTDDALAALRRTLWTQRITAMSAPETAPHNKTAITPALLDTLTYAA